MLEHRRYASLPRCGLRSAMRANPATMCTPIEEKLEQNLKVTAGPLESSPLRLCTPTWSSFSSSLLPPNGEGGGCTVYASSSPGKSCLERARVEADPVKKESKLSIGSEASSAGLFEARLRDQPTFESKDPPEQTRVVSFSSLLCPSRTKSLVATRPRSYSPLVLPARTPRS
jgi:hypothetical protein